MANEHCHAHIPSLFQMLIMSFIALLTSAECRFPNIFTSALFVLLQVKLRVFPRVWLLVQSVLAMDHSVPGALKRWDCVAKSLFDAKSERGGGGTIKNHDVHILSNDTYQSFDATHTRDYICACLTKVSVCVCVCVLGCGFSCCIRRQSNCVSMCLV